MNEEAVINVAKHGDQDDHAHDRASSHSSHESLNLDEHVVKNWSSYFRDRKRIVDYVLVYDNANQDPLHIERRNIFEQNLAAEGLELEYENAYKNWSTEADQPAPVATSSGKASLGYVKIHVPADVLTKHAEGLKMLLPIRRNIHDLIRSGKKITKSDCRRLLAERGYECNDSFGTASNSAEVIPIEAKTTELVADLATGKKESWAYRMYRKLDMFPQLEPILYRTAVPYSESRKYLFDEPQTLFKEKDRSYIVDYILQRESYVQLTIESDQPEPDSAAENGVEDGKKAEKANEFGIKRLLARGSYLAAYPLHDCPLDVDDEEDLVQYKDSLRYKLWREWARWGMAFKLQPLSHIQLYFGDQVAFYFAWLGFYTQWLIPLTLIGFLIFIYGIIMAATDDVTAELCSSNNTMCPPCINGCSYSSISNQCMNLIISRVWENEITFVWGVVVTLWCTLFIEFWKRREGTLRFEWNLYKLDQDDEPPRPEYAALVEVAMHDPQSKIKVKTNPLTGKVEPDIPYWSVQMPQFAISWLTVIVAMLIVVLTVIGTVFYRVALLTIFYRSENFWLITFGSTITSITGACISLVFIMILGFVYDKVAIWMTDREYWRTQSEYNDALMMKQTLFQFVNYYGSIFYVAFFKGNFGTIGEYAYTITTDPSAAGEASLDFGIETCPSGSCIPDLTIQLAIIMVGKQLVYGNLMELLLPKIMKYGMDLLKSVDGQSKVAEVSRNTALYGNFDLEANGPRPLFSEYLEMIIQFGFLSIFAIAFPFAPFFAVLNNVIEIRLDAMKFLKEHRRMIAAFDTGIGAWLTLLYVISRIAVLSNGALIAFTSDLIPRLMYENTYYKSMSYENFTMSFMNTSILGITNRTWIHGRIKTTIDPIFCRYIDLRYPPWSEGENVPYDTTRMYWIILAYRFVTFAAFENVILLITALVAYVIPDVPKAAEEQMQREQYFSRQLLLKMEEVYPQRQRSAKLSQGRHVPRSPPKATVASAVKRPAESNEPTYYDMPPVEINYASTRKNGSKSPDVEMSRVSSRTDHDGSSVSRSAL